MSTTTKPEAEMYANAAAIVNRILKQGADKNQLLDQLDEYMLRTQKVRSKLAELATPLRLSKFGGQNARVFAILEGYISGLEKMVSEAGSATLRAFLYSCPKRADRALGEVSKRLHVMEFLVEKLSQGIA